MRESTSALCLASWTRPGGTVFSCSRFTSSGSVTRHHWAMSEQYCQSKSSMRSTAMHLSSNSSASHGLNADRATGFTLRRSGAGVVASAVSAASVAAAVVASVVAWTLSTSGFGCSVVVIGFGLPVKHALCTETGMFTIFTEQHRRPHGARDRHPIVVPRVAGHARSPTDHVAVVAQVVGRVTGAQDRRERVCNR